MVYTYFYEQTICFRYDLSIHRNFNVSFYLKVKDFDFYLFKFYICTLVCVNDSYFIEKLYTFFLCILLELEWKKNAAFQKLVDSSSVYYNDCENWSPQYTTDGLIPNEGIHIFHSEYGMCHGSGLICNRH